MTTATRAQKTKRTPVPMNGGDTPKLLATINAMGAHPGHATNAAVAAVKTDTRQRCQRALKMLLTQRGDSFIEVERILADDPECVFGHCLRTALIVRADNAARRSMVAASVATIEAACPDIDQQARRHATAARAWLGQFGSCGRSLQWRSGRLATRHPRANSRTRSRLSPR
jgi:hypothetical protein